MQAVTLLEVKRGHIVFSRKWSGILVGTILGTVHHWTSSGTRTSPEVSIVLTSASPCKLGFISIRRVCEL